MMHYPIIPIVLDVYNNYARAAPPHSYINVMDYSSMKDLADYLVLLSKNDTLYNEYTFGAEAPFQNKKTTHHRWHPLQNFLQFVGSIAQPKKTRKQTDSILP